MKALGGLAMVAALVFMFAGEQNTAGSGGAGVQKPGGMVQRLRKSGARYEIGK